MCTVSWLHHNGGYQVLFNRDELKTRKPALPPRIVQQGGMRFIAPVDGNAGGSWIGVNQRGLTLCLLNRYQDAPTHPPSHPYTSRGLLLMRLLDSCSHIHLLERLEALDMAHYQPYNLLVLAPEQSARLVQWNGREMVIEHDAEASMPLCSSSYDHGRVIAGRQQQFQQMVSAAGRVDAAMLYAFHRSHTPEPSAYSVCMHRSDASTVSFSWIKVDGQRRRIAFLYQPHSPCGGVLSAHVAPLIDPNWNEDDAVQEGWCVVGMDLERE